MEGNKQFGNIKLSEIIRMQIETLGIDCFEDNDFLYLQEEPDWKNFRQKIREDTSIDLETTILVKERINKIRGKIDYLILGIKPLKQITKEAANNNKVKAEEIFNTFNEEQQIVSSSTTLLSGIFFSCFDKLKKNITEITPCDISQDKLAKYTFAKLFTDLLGFNQLICGKYIDLRSNEQKASLYEKSILYFFEKDDKGFYVPSLSKTNEAIKKAFKKSKKNLDSLKAIVDTNKQKSLKNVSTSWKVIKKLIFDSENVFKYIDANSVILYKQSFLTYCIIKNFQKACKKYISEKDFSLIIGDILDNMNYYKSLKDFHFGEENPVVKKMPKTSTEFLIYAEKDFGLNEIDIDYFYYDRKNLDDMKSIFDYPSQMSCISSFFSRTDGFVSKYSYYDKTEFDKENELLFKENLCCKENMGESALFFYKWYSARIEYELYKNNQSSIEKVSSAYLDTYDLGVYFAGKYLKTFIEEAENVFLQEYKLTKRTGKIKEIFKYASALGLTLQLYDAFKEAGFSDSIVNSDNIFFNLWDSGYSVADISEITGLEWHFVQSVLLKNIKFLKCNDSASLENLNHYYTKWECDELGIVSSDWND